MPIDLLHAPTSPAMPRRAVLGGLVATLTAFFGGAAFVLGRARYARSRPRRVTLDRPLTDGISFHGDVLLVRVGDRLRALSARCPHLGCRLQQVEHGQLVCACHGSRFDDAGRRERGPASRDLTELVIEPAGEVGRIDVVLAD